MTSALKLRRGTTAQHSSFTGGAGEVTVDTTKKVVVVHDGSTAGGVPLAKESDVAMKGVNNDITALAGLKTHYGVPVRQTVLSGPVDTSGYAAFGGSTGATTVTAAGTLVATAANGASASGAADRVGAIANPAWTGLSTNGTMYLYLDIAADGTCTPGASTLAPTYRWGGADVTTSGQFTFNIQEMVGKVGNGATATQAYRVYVGEVTVAGGVVSAIIWYALMGRYDSGRFAVVISTAYSKNHNIGVEPQLIKAFLAVSGGPLAESFFIFTSDYRGMSVSQITRNGVGLVTQAGIDIPNGVAAGVAGGVANQAKVIISRGW